MPPKASGSRPAKKAKPVDLGYVEDSTPTWKLTSPFFPSKVGGLPAWLDLRCVPPLLQCDSCSRPLHFLLQLYAPLDFPESFHRTLYVFVCTSKECCSSPAAMNKTMKVLRSQLPLENPVYPPTAPDTADQTLPDQFNPGKFGINLCHVCGVNAGTSRCAQCKKVSYCGKDHQTQDWKSGGHKDICKKAAEDDTIDLKAASKNDWNFKESELVVEEEVLPKESGKKKERSEKDKLAEYEKLKAEGKAGSLDDAISTAEALEASSHRSDKAFNQFKKRIAASPDQVLRYDLGGEPLWISSENILPPKDIRPCSHCKGPRVFEFQIMPQLLNDLGLDPLTDDLDWGIIAVYTCKASCPSSQENGEHKEEFAWRQDVRGDEKDD